MQNDEEYRKRLIKARGGFSVILCLDFIIDIPEAKELVYRVVSNKVSEIGDVSNNQGSNALWEMELFRRFALGNIPI